MEDLSQYPWIHFVIPKQNLDAQRALSLEIQKVDSGALVDFIDMDAHTSLLVFKKAKARKLL